MDKPPVFIDGRTSGGTSTHIQCLYRHVDYDLNTGKPRKVYWTVVWNDERWRPGVFGSIFNYGYQVVRRFQYGRASDIEDFHYDLDENGDIDSIHFVGTYAGARNYWSVVTEHYCRRINHHEIEWDAETGRPLIHSATWTHLMHNRSEMRLHDRINAARVRIADVPIKEGDRKVAEDDYAVRIMNSDYKFPSFGQMRAFDLKGNISLNPEKGNTENRHFQPQDVNTRDQTMHDILFVMLTILTLCLFISIGNRIHRSVKSTSSETKSSQTLNHTYHTSIQ